MVRTLQVMLLAALAGLLLVGGFSGGFIVGHLRPASGGLTGLKPVVPAATAPADANAATPADLQDLFKPFWEAWQLVHTQYVDQPVDDTLLMEGAIRGMVESLGDPHSSYMDPRTFADANSELEGSYEGIGAIVDTTGDYLKVVSTFPSSPAEKAGILSGDQIVALDHEDMTGIAPELVRQRVMGPAGTVVHITIARPGEETSLEFEVTRAKITIDSASGKMLENGIAYVQVTTFGDNTTRELTSALKALMAQKPKGLILDLRDNGGGYLETAVEVVSQFQDSGVALYEEYGDGTRKPYNIIPGGLATSIPMVVLINEGTASASEITAGALQDYGRAQLVGVASYGKGSVQNWVPISNDQGAVRITIARWLTPKNRQIDGKGLTPDVQVERTPEDRQADRDPQLEVATLTLQHMIAGTPFTYVAPQAPPAAKPTPQAESSVPTVPAQATFECPLAVPVRLTAGERATANTRVNLRSSPGIKDNWIGTMSAGTSAEVLGNPTCVAQEGGAYVWWQLKLADGSSGWAAEGSPSAPLYFLEPAK